MIYDMIRSTAFGIGDGTRALAFLMGRVRLLS